MEVAEDRHRRSLSGLTLVTSESEPMDATDLICPRRSGCWGEETGESGGDEPRDEKLTEKTEGWNMSPEPSVEPRLSHSQVGAPYAFRVHLYAI